MSPIEIATMFGQPHVVTFLKSLTPRSGMPCASSKACKPASPSDKRECANCGVGASDRPDLLLKVCSRCKLVYYCSETCQRQHWKTGEHKRFCVAVGARKVFKGDMSAAAPIEVTPANAGQHVVDGMSTSCLDCAVCLEPLIKSISRTLPCGHVFHRDCMAGVQSFGLSLKCPLCRSGISVY